MPITFTLTDSAGVAHSIIPLSYRIHDVFMEPSTLELRSNYDASAWGAKDYGGKVIAADGSFRPFIGYIVDYSAPLDPADGPKVLGCLSLFAMLRKRILFSRMYRRSWTIYNAINDQIGSVGLLNDSNHTVPSAIWAVEPAVPDTWLCQIGSDEWPSPDFYLGSTRLTAAPDLPSIGVNQYFQDAVGVHTWVRTTGQRPDKYPLYVSCSKNFRDTHIRRDPSSDSHVGIQTTLGPYVGETAYDFLFRLMAAQIREFEFRNNIDGYAYLYFGQNVGRFGPGGPWKTFADEKVIRAKEVSLPDRGFDSVSYKTATGEVSICSSEWDPGDKNGFFWTEERVTGFRMTDALLDLSARAQYAHRHKATGHEVELAYDPDLRPGDCIRIQKGTLDITRRVLEKVLDSKDNGKMTLILYDWSCW